MNLKAISPVIATVIIVSVAIAIAVAVAFWMTGITGLFTRYEKLEIVSAYATYDTNNNEWDITVIVRNTGTSDATIDEIFINGKPRGEVSEFRNLNTTLPYSLSAGDKVTITFSLASDGFKAGQIVEVKLHTAAGNEYPKSVQLP